MAQPSPSTSSKKSQPEITFSEEQRDQCRESPVGSVSQAASRLSLFSLSTNETQPCRSPSFEDPQPPSRKPLKALLFQTCLPITIFSMSPSSAVTVSTEYLGKPSQGSIETQAETLLEGLLTERLKSKAIFHKLFQHPQAVITTRAAGIINHENIKPVKQPATIPSGMEARKTRKELDQTQGEFFCVTQLTKETKLPPPEVSCIAGSCKMLTT